MSYRHARGMLGGQNMTARFQKKERTSINNSPRCARRFRTLCLKALPAILGSTIALFGVRADNPAIAAANVDSFDCTSMAGSGSYARPLRIGRVTRPTIVLDCPGLTSGRGFNVRYFSFSLPDRPTTESAVATHYLSAGNGLSGVHPRVAAGPRTVKHSLDAHYFNDGTYEGFYHVLADLTAGTYRLGAEKLSSPLASIETDSFNVIIIP